VQCFCNYHVIIGNAIGYYINSRPQQIGDLDYWIGPVVINIEFTHTGMDGFISFCTRSVDSFISGLFYGIPLIYWIGIV
jgi:hypothetical protein